MSVDFGDLLDDGVFAQVEYWFHEKVQENETIHLFGSIPCGPFSPIQNLNLATKGESFKKYLKKERKKSLELVSRFRKLGLIAAASGGTVSFEWPKNCAGWKEQLVLCFITELNLYSSYPTGCGFGLVIGGKKPLKE